MRLCMALSLVTSREGRVSRNLESATDVLTWFVTSREGRVSRNFLLLTWKYIGEVTSREGRVSRNQKEKGYLLEVPCHVPRGTCE